MKNKGFLIALLLGITILLSFTLLFVTHSPSQAEEIRYPVPAYEGKRLAKVRQWEKTWVGKKIDPTTVDKVKDFIPYSLYQIVPAGYISLSWVAVALFYYMLSMFLNNKKYRWMALFTLLLTVVYILIIGIAKLDPVYRIISFIVLGIVLLGLSIAYTKVKTKRDKK